MSRKEMQDSLSKHLKSNGFDVEVQVICNEADFLEHVYDFTEEQLELMPPEELLSCAGDALRCFVDERWEGSTGKNWQLMVLNEINKREGNGQ